MSRKRITTYVLHRRRKTAILICPNMMIDSPGGWMIVSQELGATEGYESAEAALAALLSGGFQLPTGLNISEIPRSLELWDQRKM